MLQDITTLKSSPMQVIPLYLQSNTGDSEGLEMRLRQEDRAGVKATAGTAMAVPVFEGEKMASLGF